MRFIKNRREDAAKLLLYLVITTFIFFHAEKMDVMTAISYLVVSAAIWAVIWFIYVFVRDAVIAVFWKKPIFPSSQYDQGDIKRRGLKNDSDDFSVSLSNASDINDPSWHLFDR